MYDVRRTGGSRFIKKIFCIMGVSVGLRRSTQVFCLISFLELGSENNLLYSVICYWVNNVLLVITCLHIGKSPNFLLSRD